MVNPCPLGMNDPETKGVKRDGVASAFWFVVPMCSGVGVGAVCGSAGQSDFGDDRWPSAGGIFCLAGDEVRLVTCF